MLKVVPPPREAATVRDIHDIRSVPRRASRRDRKVVDLRAYTGANVIRFPRQAPQS